VAVLFQFVLRLAFGLAFAMAVTSPRQVTSGYYRNHLYVTLGLCALAAVVAFADPQQFDYRLALAAAIFSYLGSVCWLYGRNRAGIVFTGLVAAAALVAATLAGPPLSETAVSARVLWWLTPASGGWVLGFTIAAMFLGHWYLNTPTMQMGPLRRLIVLMSLALIVRAVLCGLGLLWTVAAASDAAASETWFLVLRWLTGIVAPLVLAWMAWKTLAIPNTQSATGILYVAVITTFTGELMSQLLSVGAVYPL